MQSNINSQENFQYNCIGALYKSLETCDLVMVTFITAAGTDRVMGCTRNLNAVPEEIVKGLTIKISMAIHWCVYMTSKILAGGLSVKIPLLDSMRRKFQVKLQMASSGCNLCSPFLKTEL